MRIPDRSEFAELTRVTQLLGLPDPTEQLPKLENNLESVPASNSAVREIANGLREAADEMRSGAADIAWKGDAAKAFQSKVNDGTESLKQAADTIDKFADKFDVTPKEVQHIILTVLKYLGAALGLAIAIGALVPVISGLVAGTATGGAFLAAIAGIVAAFIVIYTLLFTDFPVLSEGIASAINWIKDLLCPDDPEHPKEA